MFFLSKVLGFFGNQMVQYGMIAMVIVGVIAWNRHDAAAPYVAEIKSLRKAASDKDKIIADNEKQYAEDLKDKSDREDRLNDLLESSKDGNCKFTDSELDKLRKL